MKQLDRISGYAHVAARYGLEEAIFLDSIMYWYKENRANGRNFQDGRWWTYNSVNAFVKLFPWWSAKQLRRITERCREKGAILAGNYNDDQRDRTLWYTPSDELLGLYGIEKTGESICPNGQTDLSERASTLAQTGKSYIEHVNTHVDTMKNPLPPKNSPDEVEPVFDTYAGEDVELRQRLSEFQENRRKAKKPLHTQRAARILVNKLDRLSGGDRAMKLALLDNAILHNWDSVYQLKEDERPRFPDTQNQHEPLRDDWVTFS